jgi:hypothetical protein
MTIYRSKVDIWLAALVFGLIIYALAESINDKDYEGLYVIIPIMLLIISLYWQIKYIISDGYLEVKAGIFGSAKVPVSQIKSVHKTYNPLSAPALSIKRLEVKYGKFDYLLISPKNKQAFVDELKAINPDIDIKI